RRHTRLEQADLVERMTVALTGPDRTAAGKSRQQRAGHGRLPKRCPAQRRPKKRLPSSCSAERLMVLVLGPGPSCPVEVSAGQAPPGAAPTRRRERLSVRDRDT